jgi:hypothetical protein
MAIIASYPYLPGHRTILNSIRITGFGKKLPGLLRVIGEIIGIRQNAQSGLLIQLQGRAIEVLPECLA